MVSKESNVFPLVKFSQQNIGGIRVIIAEINHNVFKKTKEFNELL